jgi:hypothetical protein
VAGKEGARMVPKMGEIAVNSMAHLLPVLGKKLLVDIEAGDVAGIKKRG